MYKHAHRSKKNALRNDLEKLKALLALTAHDAQGQAKMAIKDQYDFMKDTSHDYEVKLIDYVNDKPFKALGIAAFTGLVLGLLYRRK